MSALVRFATVLVAAAAVSLMGVLLGAWWAPLIGGLAAGAFIPRAGWAVLAGAIAGLVSWGVPLEYAHLQYGLAATSLSLAAIMGFNGAAMVPVILAGSMRVSDIVTFQSTHHWIVLWPFFENVSRLLPSNI